MICCGYIDHSKDKSVKTYTDIEGSAQCMHVCVQQQKTGYK